MNGTTKFVIGAAVTSLMAMASHSWLGMGAGFIDNLEQRARTAVGEAGGAGVNVAFLREPSLQRVAVLSGNADAVTRERLLAAVRALPGVREARWADDGAAAAAPAEAPATAEAVANCQTTVDAAIAGQTIQFDRGSAVISASSNALLDALGTTLAPCEGTTVEVSGHTDPSGTPGTNQTLSEARAQAVVTALTGRNVPAARLTARGYGSSQPKVEGRGREADAANRRIEFRVSASGAAAPAAAPAAAGE
jgi:OmpA-OmpF porin, OOP family